MDAAFFGVEATTLWRGRGKSQDTARVEFRIESPQVDINSEFVAYLKEVACQSDSIYDRIQFSSSRFSPLTLLRPALGDDIDKVDQDPDH